MNTEQVDARLKHWAKEVIGGLSYGSGRHPIAVMMESGCHGSGGACGRTLINTAADEIESLVVQLPEKLKDAVMKWYLSDMPQDVVSRRCGCSVRTLERRLQQAREIIAGALARRAA